ncbi:LuxR family transcriptional regulator [Sphingomonas sp. ABOLD]|uniref:DNA-binding NarL/FixJ family response regulator n=1 Tax=Sphingomonas trueperi TaxID=53317 RepID=A0A7X5Y4S3_9SPHN|nr:MULTISPECIES: helix-turn-helix transcriptional regulator [Sphingomonas]NJB99456.1 DNA-binding NarL/FixJ family response regulator [Sphingomonas trueperi]RSV35160.1 LuxR family transcriptional regulator [Sphingomonas sp. ABOLE]RSV35776.1 LuxR family transcriptional regulator [Sphingomonas sp. ABOLD]
MTSATALRAPSPPSDAEQLAQLIAELREAEARRGAATREIRIGAFTVPGWRVPLLHLAGLQTLTRNEAAVLRFLGWGRANGDIGTLLNMTENTVRTHMNNAIRKLDLDGVRELNSLAGLLFLPLE